MLSLQANNKVLTVESFKWVAVCLCFLLSTVVMPAYSAALTASSIADSAFSNSSSAVSKTAQPNQMFMADTQNDAKDHQTHSKKAANSPCDNHDCDNMTNCGDSCTTNNCSPSPLAPTACSKLPQVSIGSSSPHKPHKTAAVIARRVEPPFRPPIH